MQIEHPGQILTRTEYERRRALDIAGGTIESPTTLYLTNQGTTLGPALLVEPWRDYEHKARETHTSRAQLHGDQGHRDGCASGTFTNWERDTCGTCALLGWGSHDESGDPAPNYAGWARVYVQAREPIPRAWFAAFVAELNSDNERYCNALRRDVATWGYRLTDEKPGYRLPTPTGEKMLAWLREYHDDDADAVRGAVLDILENAEADYPAGPYPAASVRAARRALQLLDEAEPAGAGSDPAGRPDPRTHPEAWTE